MAKAANAKSRRVKRLYFSAKISDYQFKKVLWHFVLDHSAAETAKHVTLSANSISAIYTKLRTFFFDYGLFRDIYKGGNPADGTDRPDEERFEFSLIDFHLQRVAQKHGSLDSAMDEPDYHFAESFWRHHYRFLIRERPAELVQRMMAEHLMTFIRTFGPVGERHEPTDGEKQEGRQLALKLFDQMVIWLKRNSAKFKKLKGMKTMSLESE